MTTAYTSLLGLALPVTGELSGTWGDTVNNSITSLLDSAIAGTTTLSADTTLTTTTGASNQARQAILLCTGHSANITITAPAQSKIYTVINVSATYTVKIRGAGPTTGITIPVSSTATVAWNGSDFVDASGYINGNLRVNGTLSVTGAVTFTAGTASTTTGTGTLVITGGLGVSGRINAANFDGIVGANTAAAGAFTSLTASTTLTVTGAGSIEGLTVGKGAGAVATNTAVGASALVTNTSGSANSALGLNSLGANTTGTDNTSVGRSSMTSSTTGSFNTALGSGSLALNTTASNNTAVGYQAGYTNSTGANNVFLGNVAGYSSSGSSNLHVGYGAGYSSTGSNNTFVGAFGTGSTACGGSMTTGSKNTILGAYSGNQGGLDIRTSSNHIVLSDGDGNPRCYWTNNGVMVQSISYTDNYVAQIKNSTATRPYGLYINFSAATPNNTTENFLNCADSTNEKCIIYSSGTVTNRTGTYNAFSDIKLKQDVVDAGSQWDDIKAVRVRKFRLKDDVVANPETKHLIGVIAQELELTSAGLIDDCVDKEGDVTKSVKYSILYMKAVKALQEAMERIEQLEARLDAANL